MLVCVIHKQVFLAATFGNNTQNGRCLRKVSYEIFKPVLFIKTLWIFSRVSFKRRICFLTPRRVMVSFLPAVNRLFSSSSKNSCIFCLTLIFSMLLFSFFCCYRISRILYLASVFFNIFIRLERYWFFAFNLRLFRALIARPEAILENDGGLAGGVLLFKSSCVLFFNFSFSLLSLDFSRHIFLIWRCSLGVWSVIFFI